MATTPPAPAYNPKEVAAVMADVKKQLQAKPPSSMTQADIMLALLPAITAHLYWQVELAEAVKTLTTTIRNKS